VSRSPIGRTVVAFRDSDDDRNDDSDHDRNDDDDDDDDNDGDDVLYISRNYCSILLSHQPVILSLTHGMFVSAITSTHSPSP